MRLIRQFAPVLCLVAGCGFAQKPYANDPLLRGGRAVWLARDSAPQSAQLTVEPPPPPATSRFE
ncbi:MAG TPA: hypothetical protein VGE74_18510 [Gemmata sp.]